jgi:hypothetical protein
VSGKTTDIKGYEKANLVEAVITKKTNKLDGTWLIGTRARYLVL